jgi:hypothetical protein
MTGKFSRVRGSLRVCDSGGMYPSEFVIQVSYVESLHSSNEQSTKVERTPCM